LQFGNSGNYVKLLIKQSKYVQFISSGN